MSVLSFYKPEIMRLLSNLEQPTPTDSEHPAHWWNTTFGRNIKSSFDVYMAGVIEQISKAKEE